MTISPRAEPVLAAARALGPKISALADAIERERRLPPPLVDEMLAAGLFRMLVPASLGGLELDLPSYVQVVEALARADASVAWCVGQSSGLSTESAYMPPETAHEVFVACAGRRPIMANGPGEGNRPGRAVETDGGYRVTGQWNFASGLPHAGWLLGICNLYAADGTPRTDPDGSLSERLMLVPIEQATIIDRWHVSGLRGTGSQSFSMDDLFVPAARCIWIAEHQRHEDGTLYRFPTSATVFGPSFGSVGLGIADAIMESFVEMASGKTPRGMSRTVRESQVVQAMVAHAHARLRAARLLLHQTLWEVWNAVSATCQVTLDQQVAVRLASTHAIHEAAAVVDAIYQAAGSTAVFQNQPFERRFRDMHAVTQQLQGRAAHYETVGRFLLGLDPSRAFI